MMHFFLLLFPFLNFLIPASITSGNAFFSCCKNKKMKENKINRIELYVFFTTSYYYLKYINVFKMDFEIFETHPNGKC